MVLLAPKELIEELAGSQFQEASDTIESRIDTLGRPDFIIQLETAGIIPEAFNHDSTEEKLYAKFCDSLFKRGLIELGYESSIISERGDTADVRASGFGHSLVGDAKAFRLSRTAKNQKDFKVTSLDSWRNGANYSCLLGPLQQYPQRRSRIYSDAIVRNVTLLSYTHLAFLVSSLESPVSLEALWSFPSTLSSGNQAESYFQELDNVVLGLTSKTAFDLSVWKDNATEIARRQAQEQIDYLEGIKSSFVAYTKEELLNELLRSLKIEERIRTVRNWL